MAYAKVKLEVLEVKIDAKKYDLTTATKLPHSRPPRLLIVNYK